MTVQEFQEMRELISQVTDLNLGLVTEEELRMIVGCIKIINIPTEHVVKIRKFYLGGK